MKTQNTFLKLSLITLIGIVLLLPLSAMGQNSAIKRKVSHRVVPDYPPVARQMDITGKVKLEAIVEPNGQVKSTRPVGGSPLLIQAAATALKKWKFAPGPKETTEVVEFDFTGQQ